MNELKPCPFCGGEGQMRSDTDWFDTPGSNNWWVQCVNHNINADVPCLRDSDTEAEAISAWNKRPSQWISVMEQMPKREGDECWVWNGKNTERAEWLDNRGWGQHIGEHIYLLETRNITHWMYIEPPNGPVILS